MNTMTLARRTNRPTEPQDIEVPPAIVFHVLCQSIRTSTRMSSTPQTGDTNPLLSKEFMRMLGVRRSTRLRRIMRQTNLPPEALLDLALEILDITSRRLVVDPIQRQAVGLGAARWRNVSPEERSEAMRRAVQARWAKQRQSGSTRRNTK